MLVTLGMALDKSINRIREEYTNISEDSRGIYTGKIKNVYNPLDKGYIVTPTLKSLIKLENNHEFTKFNTWPVLSIRVAPGDLYDRDRGIIQNSKKKGRLWERASFVSYYKNGKNLFSSHAGLRIHGGASRRNPATIKSFRLYFRDAYGKKEFLPGENVSLKYGTKVKTLILRIDKRYHFAHDFSFSLTNEIGGLAPHITPIALFLNGNLYAYHFMSEYLDRDQIKYYFGHNNFLFYKLKGNNDSESHLLYEKALNRMKYSLAPIDYELIKSKFDLENLTASMLIVLYTGMTDWAQGAMIRDKNEMDSKWKWISWDNDNTFYIDRKRYAQSEVKFPWQVDGFNIALKMHTDSLRSMLFNRLLKESPQYKEYFLTKVDEFFDKHLTKKFISRKFYFYQRLIYEADNNPKMIRDFERIRNFVKNRKPEFCKQLEKTLGEQASTCLK